MQHGRIVGARQVIFKTMLRTVMTAPKQNDRPRKHYSLVPIVPWQIENGKKMSWTWQDPLNLM